MQNEKWSCESSCFRPICRGFIDSGSAPPELDYVAQAIWVLPMDRMGKNLHGDIGARGDLLLTTV